MHVYFYAFIEVEIRYRITYFRCIFIRFMLEISVDIHAKIIPMNLITIFACKRNRLRNPCDNFIALTQKYFEC